MLGSKTHSHCAKQTVHYLLHPNKSSGSIPSASDLTTPKNQQIIEKDTSESGVLNDLSYVKEKATMEAR